MHLVRGSSLYCAPWRSWAHWQLALLRPAVRVRDLRVGHLVEILRASDGQVFYGVVINRFFHCDELVAEIEFMRPTSVLLDTAAQGGRLPHFGQISYRTGEQGCKVTKRLA